MADVQLEKDKRKMQIVWHKTCFCFRLMYTSKIKENLLVDIYRMIKKLCMSDRYEYIDNDNIPRDMLYKDGFHLLDKGNCFLPRNFIENLNHFLETHVYHPTVRLETLI